MSYQVAGHQVAGHRRGAGGGFGTPGIPVHRVGGGGFGNPHPPVFQGAPRIPVHRPAGNARPVYVHTPSAYRSPVQARANGVGGALLGVGAGLAAGAALGALAQPHVIVHHQQPIPVGQNHVIVPQPQPAVVYHHPHACNGLAWLGTAFLVAGIALFALGCAMGILGAIVPGVFLGVLGGFFLCSSL